MLEGMNVHLALVRPRISMESLDREVAELLGQAMTSCMEAHVLLGGNERPRIPSSTHRVRNLCFESGREVINPRLKGVLYTT